MRGWIRVLTVTGWILGAAVILYGLDRFMRERNVPALLVSLAVIIAGPEDVLKSRLRHKAGTEEEPTVKLVDLATSVAFLVLLLIVVYLLP